MKKRYLGLFIISLIIIPFIFAQESQEPIKVSESLGPASYYYILFYSFLALLIIALIYFYLKKLEFDYTKVVESFKQTRLKIILTLIFIPIWYFFLIASVPLCDICLDPIPTNCPYNQYVLFQSCNCGCYTLNYVIQNYIYLIFPIIIFYVGYSILAVIFRRKKI